MKKGGKKKLSLIVEDDPATGSILKDFLSDLSDVIVITSKDSLADQCRQHHPDIVFIDWHSFSADNMGLLRDIKTAEKDAFVIMMTEAATVENIKAARQNGADSFIAKPFDRNTVIRNFHRSGAHVAAVGAPV
jgi:two-component system, response regulator, stage 0 sporulation protein F